MNINSYPFRMNLLDIVIRSLDTVETLMDIDFYEPSGSRRYSTCSKTYKLKGQVNYKKTEEQTPAKTGDIEESLGHLVFKNDDMKAQYVDLKKGDKVVSIAGRDVNYKIVEIRPQAHLDGRSNTTHVFFKEDATELGAQLV